MASSLQFLRLQPLSSLHPKSFSSKLPSKTLSFRLSKPCPLQLRTSFRAPARTLVARAVRKLSETDPVPVSSGPGSEFPNGSGVYGVYDENGELQFIGISRNIAASIATHSKLGPQLCSLVKVSKHHSEFNSCSFFALFLILRSKKRSFCYGIWFRKGRK